MPIGYDAADRVWAVDKLAKLAGPVHRDLVTCFPDRYTIDEDHPVVDYRGALLPSKPLTDKAPAATTTTARKGKED